MPVYQFTRSQKIPSKLETVWDFISQPANLKEITPDYMGFDISSKDLPDKMYEGMIIIYRVSPIFGIKTTWVTEITHVRELAYFVDEQRAGPYKLWHHQHLLQPIENGVLMKDIVSYQPPGAVIGAVADKLIIRKKLNEIFKYREKALVKKFGRYNIQ